MFSFFSSKSFSAEVAIVAFLLLFFVVVVRFLNSEGFLYPTVPDVFSLIADYTSCFATRVQRARAKAFTAGGVG